MKHLSKILIALVLALVIAGTLPAQVFADSLPEYISEVKVYEGSCDKAESEGFKILCDEKGNPVDLNQGSGSKEIGAKGNKKVYLGYKTTTDRKDAITDLALMNMKGGYDVAEYDKLMEGQMSRQIVPFVENFLAAINEYRENNISGNSAARQRAQYIRGILNKFTDDDTDGAGLGDLLLNETVYEMAKPKWDALSDKEKEKTSFYEINNKVRDALPEAEKNKHADILTIIAQSNGKATLMMQNLLTRAADTTDSTWLERLEGTTYEDLLEINGGATTDTVKALDKKYEDDADKILENWDDFRNDLLNYDEYVEFVEKFDEEAVQQAYDRFANLNENSPDDELTEAATAYADAQNKTMEMIKAAEMVAIHDWLDTLTCGDGTMLDYFMTDKEEIKEDITLLYPFVASLSEGQRAGLDFVTIRELVVIAMSEPEEYKDSDLEKLSETSVYDGVDRAIYQKGGVALTSDAIRSDVILSAVEEDTSFSPWTIAMAAITAVTFTALAASAVSWGVLSYKASYYDKLLNAPKDVWQQEAIFTSLKEKGIQYKIEVPVPEYGPNATKNVWINEIYESKAAVAKYLTVGLTVAVIVLSAVTVYLGYRDMKAHYNVDFTPIPHYMVEEKDITVTNESGEKIVIKNQSAYYKAVESNRKKGDDYFNKIDTCADMNGCVNPQWLALYAQKSDMAAPVLAASLKAVVGDMTVPSGYETGIHMFGEKAAFNLNNKLYCWNQSAKSVMVYFKVDTAAAKTAGAAGSNFTAGNLALAGIGGLAIGALCSALAVSAAGKKKKGAAAA